MGLLSNTVSIYQYRVKGMKPQGSFSEWVLEKLNLDQFESIDNNAERESTGWVRLDNPNRSEFEHVGQFQFDHYLAFTLRRDTRSVPTSVIKSRLSLECEEWLAARPMLKKMPFKAKAELRENLEAALLGRTFATPSTWDLLWDTDKDLVTICTTNQKTLDLIEDQFATTFDGLRLAPIHPMERAKSLLDETQNASLSRLNQSSSQDVLEQINCNRWLGWDFLLWLTLRTANGPSTYNVASPGPLAGGEGFIAYLHDRFVLVSEQDDEIRKSAITGPQKEYSEAKQALASGKNMTEGTIFMEKGEDQWRLNLKADIFAFNSYKCPKVTIEKDASADPDQERLAVFFERMYLMEAGIQMFESVLKDFLVERIAPGWNETASRIAKWLQA